MPDDITYKPTRQQIADMQSAAAALKRLKDYNERFRKAGEPDADREARTAELEDRMNRYAKAFDIPID